MLKIRYSSRFKKDYKTIVKRGYDVRLLEEVLNLLVQEQVLPQKYLIAQEIGFDRRIPPRGTATETYSIQATGQTFTATVRLLYRSISQATMDANFPRQKTGPIALLSARSAKQHFNIKG